MWITNPVHIAYIGADSFNLYILQRSVRGLWKERGARKLQKVIRSVEHDTLCGIEFGDGLHAPMCSFHLPTYLVYTPVPSFANACYRCMYNRERDLLAGPNDVQYISQHLTSYQLYKDMLVGAPRVEF